MCTTLKLIKVNSERSFWQFIPYSVLAFGLCVSEAFLREVLGVGWSSSGMSVIVIFYLVAKTCMFNSVSRIYCHVRTIVIELTSASKNQILFCKDSSLCNFDCPHMRQYVFFYKWSREIFRYLQVTWRYSVLHFSFENVSNEQKVKPWLTFRGVNIYE